MKNEISLLKDYYDDLSAKVSNKDESRFMNKDRAHNAVVMRVILEHSKHIKMFCGKLSIFHSSFAEKVRKSCEGDDSIYLDPMKELYKSLGEFLVNKEHRLDIVLENLHNDFLEDSPVKEVLLKNLNAQVRIYTLNKGCGVEIDHFTIGDERMYRREIDKESHQAICCLNNEKGAMILSSTFDSLIKSATPYKQTLNE